MDQSSSKVNNQTKKTIPPTNPNAQNSSVNDQIIATSSNQPIESQQSQNKPPSVTQETKIGI